MKGEEEIFEIAVKINQGLEPLTFTITAYDDASTSGHVTNFTVTRDKEVIGKLRPDAENCWKLVEGDIDEEQVDAIGAAIDRHYA